MDKQYVDVGERIKKYRLLLGMTQEQLGNEINSHQSEIGIIERGERQVTIPRLKKITEALGVTLSEFFADEEKPCADTQLKRIENALKNLTEDKKKAVADSVISIIKTFEKDKNNE